MYGKVLGTSQQLAVFADTQVFTLIAHTLQTANNGQSHTAGQIGVFAVGLLSASPAWVTEYVDVWCPERQALIPLDVARLLGLLGFGTCLVADGGKHLMQQCVIPRGSHRHRDGEYGGKAVTSYAVQCFVPPLELGDTQSGNGWRCVHHQLGFLFQRQPTQKVVSTLFRSQVWVLVGQCLCTGSQCHEAQEGGE